MYIELKYGISKEMPEVIEEDARNKKGLNVISEIKENNNGDITVTVSSQWKFELIKYTERFLGDYGDMAPKIVEDYVKGV